MSNPGGAARGMDRSLYKDKGRPWRDRLKARCIERIKQRRASEANARRFGLGPGPSEQSRAGGEFSVAAEVRSGTTSSVGGVSCTGTERPRENQYGVWQSRALTNIVRDAPHRSGVRFLSDLGATARRHTSLGRHSVVCDATPLFQDPRGNGGIRMAYLWHFPGQRF